VSATAAAAAAGAMLKRMAAATTAAVECLQRWLLVNAEMVLVNARRKV
jgi:hypothetical protein